MQNYLASCDTPQYFDWLYILQMNNLLRASCKTAHTKRRDWTAIRNLNLRRKSSRTSCKPPHTKRRDCTVQFNRVAWSAPGFTHCPRQHCLSIFVRLQLAVRNIGGQRVTGLCRGRLVMSLHTKSDRWRLLPISPSDSASHWSLV